MRITQACTRARFLTHTHEFNTALNLITSSSSSPSPSSSSPHAHTAATSSTRDRIDYYLECPSAPWAALFRSAPAEVKLKRQCSHGPAAVSVLQCRFSAEAAPRSSAGGRGQGRQVSRMVRRPHRVACGGRRKTRRKTAHRHHTTSRAWALLQENLPPSPATPGGGILVGADHQRRPPLKPLKPLSTTATTSSPALHAPTINVDHPSSRMSL